MKKILSVIISIILVFMLFVPSYGTGSHEKLYNVYGDGMLFQQNKEAILSGTGTPGKTVSCALIDSEGMTAASASCVVGTDGKFSLSFTAPHGSYEEYKIELKSDGTVFDTLKNVVFGELWLSGGQSNMQIELIYSKTGAEMYRNGTRGSKNVRYFYSAPVPDYNGIPNALPAEPQTEIKGCCWFDGTDERIFNMSAVGFFFAEKLQRDLGMPVGLLSGSLGGSSLTAWISPDAAENSKAVRSLLGSSYVSPKDRKEDGSLAPTAASSGMYNLKIAPLAPFRPAGMIWYQGESDASWKYGRYTKLFDVLQRSYSELFGYGEGDMPIVYSALCDFSFGDVNAFKLISAEFADMQRLRPQSRAVVSLTDIPLDYNVSTQACHPICKKPVGERMAYSAEGLVYNKNNCFCSPVLKKTEVRDGSVFMTFDNAGDTLKSDGERLYGFTICSKNGVYIAADAEIVSPDTVRVYSENIKEPAAAMYANGLITERCNLYSSEDGELLLPAMPAVSDRSKTKNILTDFGWTDCDCPEIWREESLTTAGFYEIWSGENADVTVSEASSYKGCGGLEIKGRDSGFSVSPILKYYDEADGSYKKFQEFNGSMKHYDSISVMLRNDGKDSVSLSKIKIRTSKGKELSPVVDGTKKTDYIIPADGKWYKVKFSLNTLKFSDKPLIIAASRTYLGDVDGIEFCFEGSGAEISMDEISFTTASAFYPPLKLPGNDLFAIICNAISDFIMLMR